MNISVPISSEITSVSFSFYLPEQTKKLSVKRITNPVIFDNLGRPTQGGLYDSALGPMSSAYL